MMVGDEFNYSNIAVKIDAKKQKIPADPCATYLGRECSFTKIFSRVKDLDPNDFHERDGPWIKERSQDIRTKLNALFGDAVGLNASGRHDAENLYDAWSEYCDSKHKPTWVDALIVTYRGTDFMRSNRNDGKKIGETGKDTGEKGDDTTAAVKNKKIREQQARASRAYRRRLKVASGDINEEDVDVDEEEDVGRIIKKTMSSLQPHDENATKIEAARALASYSEKEFLPAKRRAVKFLDSFFKDDNTEDDDDDDDDDA
jgi:hypothetical protein